MVNVSLDCLADQGFNSLGGFVSTGYLACSFDLINVADLDVISQAARRCSHLIVGVFSDELCQALLGRLPIVPLDERMALVSHIRGVGDVVVHNSHGTKPDAGVMLFEVTGMPAGLPTHATVLTPQRQSSSLVLRNALRYVIPIDREAVA